MQIKTQYTKNQIEFFTKTADMFPGTVSFTRKQLLQVKDALGYSVIPVWITGDPARKVVRGTYSLPECKMEDRKSTRLNSSHVSESRMPSSA